jgi:hypothetical protein
MHREALDRRARAVVQILSALTGTGARVRLDPPASAAKPERLTEAGARAERLTRVRKKDPALDVAANVLDLEVLD